MWEGVEDGSGDGGVIIAAASKRDLCHHIMFQANKVTRISTKQDVSVECPPSPQREEEEIHLAQKGKEVSWFRKILMDGAG